MKTQVKRHIACLLLAAQLEQVCTAAMLCSCVGAVGRHRKGVLAFLPDEQNKKQKG